MRYEKPVWVFFRRRKIAHLVRSWWICRSEGGVTLKTVCGRWLEIEDPVLKLLETTGFDPRTCLQCRGGWDE